MNTIANLIQRTICLHALILLLFVGSTHGQKVYLPTEESLRVRHTPEWYGNAKLGIFVHWGLYSVPGWAKPDFSVDKVKDWKLFYRNNPYAEWYLNSLRIAGSPTVEYHRKTYGSDFDYYRFRDTLAHHAKQWKADEWAKLFRDIGAKYVVITSKHSDGYVMYPSKVAHPFYDKEEITSARDYIGELEKASRQQGLKFGVYYCGGLDWSFNHSPVTNLWPDLFQNMPTSVAYTAYADSHMHELVRRYKPDVLWNDVNYPKNGDFLGIFSELFTINPDAVTNDRWLKHEELYDFTTPEYVVLDSISSEKWETCRGLGYSFGFNRMEDEKQTISSRDLVRLLVDIVSKNGNLLLNVGPRDDGSIPQIQIDRLNDLGKWMKIHGEGIYDTRPWKTFSHKSSDGLDLRFTRKGDDLYVFVFNLPKNKKIHVPHLSTSNNSEAMLFGDVNAKMKMVRSGRGVDLTIPDTSADSFCRMVKITGIRE